MCHAEGDLRKGSRASRRDHRPLSRRGIADPVTLVVLAVLGIFLLVPKLNLFDRSADPSNRRTASAISGHDIVEITNAVATSDKPVTVKVDRSVEASAEVTDPKLTLGQKIGRFFSGLGTWAIIGYLVVVFVFGLSPTFFMGWRKEQYKGALKNVVGGIRLLGKEDPDAYDKVTNKISVHQTASGKARRDQKLVDRVKADLH